MKLLSGNVVIYEGGLPFNAYITLDRYEGDTYTYFTFRDDYEILIDRPTNEIDSVTFETFLVPNHPDGVLISGVVWATCNVDNPGTFAAKPTDAGKFYQWGRMTARSCTDPLISNDGSVWTGESFKGDTWYPHPCPTGWRLPTEHELDLLINSGNYSAKVSGVLGHIFGDNVNRIFLPVAGTRAYFDGTHFNKDRKGYYWSSTPAGNRAYTMQIYFGTKSYIEPFIRSEGASVRCVKEVITE